MVLHELITNAAKYGALARPEGRILLHWERIEGEDARDIRLIWKESGLSGVMPPERDGFGLKMIALSAGHELGGTAAADWRDEGLTLTLQFPLAAE